MEPFLEAQAFGYWWIDHGDDIWTGPFLTEEAADSVRYHWLGEKDKKSRMSIARSILPEPEDKFKCMERRLKEVFRELEEIYDEMEKMKAELPARRASARRSTNHPDSRDGKESPTGFRVKEEPKET